MNDLQSSTAKWKVVYFHYPPYISGGYQVEDLRQLCPVLEQYGVDIVFNSHTIVYERSHPLREGKVDFDDGIVYIVAGGAGSMPEWLLPKREWHTAQSLAVPHFVQVVATSDNLEVRAIDEEGRLFDKWHVKKNADGKKLFF
ncbi:metallophosphoesterase [Paenibacillus sp. N3/727]|nr:metallophosphoesterase [Paenibacillus sp. N3/727]UNK21316.1 metallophosphoesterase [Paenibacillus sp. N3/727]